VLRWRPWFRKFFVVERGDPPVTAIGKADASRYLDWRRTRRGGRGAGPVSQRTLCKDFAVLRTLFGWAVEHREYRPDNPVVRHQFDLSSTSVRPKHCCLASAMAPQSRGSSDTATTTPA
jgi:hypothetical protein